jgi:hypothetical protein
MAGTVKDALALGVTEAVANVVVHAHGDRRPWRGRSAGRGRSTPTRASTVRDAMALCITDAVANVVVHAYPDRSQPGDVETTSTGGTELDMHFPLPASTATGPTEAARIASRTRLALQPPRPARNRWGQTPKCSDRLWGQLSSRSNVNLSRPVFTRRRATHFAERPTRHRPGSCALARRRAR